MAQAKKGDTVKVEYTGKLDDGKVFDTSVNREPLEFKIGDGLVIKDFEEAIVGMNPGEAKNIKIPAEKAYGQYNPERVLDVKREQFPDHMKPEIGQRLQVSRPDGQIVVFTVKEISETNVSLDANHPLAGKDLNFDIQLVEIV